MLTLSALICVVLLQIIWVVNATRSVAFSGSLTGSVRIGRDLTFTAGVSWTAVGISVRQVRRLMLLTQNTKALLSSSGTARV
jgi:hypothetical protein